MTDPINNYKKKPTFWKREAGRVEGESARSPVSDVERGSFWPSWLGSLLIHGLVILLVLVTINSRPPAGGTVRGRSTDSVGIVFSSAESGGGSDSAETSEGSEAVDESVDPSDESRPEDQANEAAVPAVTDRIGMTSSAPRSDKPAVTRIDFGPSTSEDSARSHSTNDGGHGGGKGGKTGRGDGGGQLVGFGGLKGNGRRFVYVIDRSESMRWPGDLPIRYALDEAKASVESLDPKQGAKKFQVVCYNHDARIFENGRLLDVTPANKRRAIAYLDTVTADGGTDPLTALEKAIRLAPDVIFFLTDADEEISPMVLTRIRELRIRGRVGQIHVMEFGRPTGRRLHSFRKLADQNNGVYIFKDVTALRGGSKLLHP